MDRKMLHSLGLDLQDLRDLQEVTGEMVMGVTKAILGSCWAGC